MACEIEEFKIDGIGEIEVYTLRNQDGLSISVCNYGGIITKIEAPDKHGRLRDIIMGFESIFEYFSPAYLKDYFYAGALIGRYANRIKGGKFVVNDNIYQISKNVGQNTLHGGFKGFDKKIFKVKSIIDDPAQIILEYLSPNQEEGFPGNLIVTASIKCNQNKIITEINCITDEPTPVNVTWHPYFNLNKDHNNTFHHLHINSDTILDQDEEQCSSGEITNVENTIFDFRSSRFVDISKLNIDHSFVLQHKANEIISAAKISSENEDINMEILTNQPSIHLYTGDGLPLFTGKNKSNILSGSGFCLETQQFANGVNLSNFPNQILLPDQIFNYRTDYVFCNV